jgi:hypothetical protein
VNDGQPILDGDCLRLVLVQASDAITQVNGVTADNEYRWGFVFLLEAALDEVAVENFDVLGISESGLRQPAPILELNLKLTAWPPGQVNRLA